MGKNIPSSPRGIYRREIFVACPVSRDLTYLFRLSLQKNELYFLDSSDIPPLFEDGTRHQLPLGDR
jgi:hypothetical protein